MRVKLGGLPAVVAEDWAAGGETSPPSRTRRAGPAALELFQNKSLKFEVQQTPDAAAVIWLFRGLSSLLHS